MIRAALAFGLYRFFLIPLAYLLVNLLFPILPSKIREMVIERREPRKPPLLSKPIWIHAASGEIEYAKPVIRALKEKYPSIPILVTYFSPSAKRLIQNFPGVDLLMPLPWDRPSEVREFFDRMKPLAGLFARTDVWPCFATEARRREIPLLLFSATLSRESARRQGFARWLKLWTFSRLNRIFCVSEEDVRNFQSLGRGLSLEVAGDSRFDQVFARLNETSKLPSSLRPSIEDFVFVMGSTWPADEDVLLANAGFYLKNSIRPLIVPHETGGDHLSAIEKKLDSHGVKTQRLSKSSVWKSDTCLLVDQVGVLAELYQWGQIAFVGGSFKDKVHSVMEPLAAGLPVLVGPHHANNREALQFQGVRLNAGETAVREIRGTADLQDRLLFWKKQSMVKTELQGLVQARTGASTRILNWVETNLGLPNHLL